MTTSTDIANRSLQLLGTRTTIASLVEQSNEAIQVNLVYTPVVNWCLDQANWNFARQAAVLTVLASFTGSPWTTAQPVPPWISRCQLPADYVRAIYVFDTTALASPATAFTGEPARFVVSGKAGTTVPTLLCNLAAPGLVYTNTADENQWSPAFERFVVHALAYTLASTMTGMAEFTAALFQRMVQLFISAEQLNREEGLMFGDTTPEWIQAIGIPYPERRLDRRRPQQPPRRGDNGNDG